jgi:hypothetical protein
VAAPFRNVNGGGLMLLLALGFLCPILIVANGEQLPFQPYVAVSPSGTSYIRMIPAQAGHPAGGYAYAVMAAEADSLMWSVHWYALPNEVYLQGRYLVRLYHQTGKGGRFISFYDQGIEIASHDISILNGHSGWNPIFLPQFCYHKGTFCFCYVTKDNVRTIFDVRSGTVMSQMAMKSSR